jgi:hypothetical protein
MPLMMSIGRKGIRMRRFRILAWVAVSLAAWCGSAARASAQTYDFTFSGGGVSIPDGMLPHSGGNVTSVSGTLSGVSPGKDNGALSLLFTVPQAYTIHRQTTRSLLRPGRPPEGRILSVLMDPEAVLPKSSQTVFPLTSAPLP